MAEIINFTEFEEKAGRAAFEASKVKAKKIISDPDKMARLLLKLEEKLKLIPKVGDKLANIPVLVSLFRSYMNNEYTDLPIGTIIALVAALVYFVSPIDLVPDPIPGIGLVDDALVIAICMSQIDSDVKEYREWLTKSGRVI